MKSRKDEFAVDLNCGISLHRNSDSTFISITGGESEEMERIFQVEVSTRVAKAGRNVFLDTACNSCALPA